jgi:hypothetical protein
MEHPVQPYKRSAFTGVPDTVGIISDRYGIFFHFLKGKPGSKKDFLKP